MLRIRFGFVFAVAIAAAMLVSPEAALAEGTWRWPLKGPVALEYGARYADEQGRSCSHGGLDIAAAAGASVTACVAGEVAFSGLVPAGAGRRAWAVTVLTADGLRVTYLPLERATVARGEAVTPGEGIGELSPAGDGSGAASHLHLGVRRGETALDPCSFLAAVESSAQSGKAPALAHSPAPAPSRAPVRPSVHAPSVTQAQAPVVGSRSSAVSHAPASVTSPKLSGARPSAVVPSRSPLIAPVAPKTGLEILNRIAPVADSPRIRTAAVSADVGKLRDLLEAVLVRLALAGVAAACVWPALRGVLAMRVGRVPEAVAIRHDGA